MKDNKIIKNIIIGFGGQFIIIVLGIIVPRIMIVSYGSDLNGLLNTISQIFIYMSLLEAGIGQAARNALMKPLAEKDCKSISYITSIAYKYFRKFTLYYGLGVFLLAIVCPFVIKTDVRKTTIFAIILFEGLSGALTFSQSQTVITVLSADGRNYINNGINVINKFIGYAVKIILAFFGINILVVEAVFFVITILKVVFYNFYFKKHYSWIDLKSAPNNAKLEDRNSYVLTEIAWTIFSSTDLIVLSIFVNTKESSVYGVYNLIYSNIGLLLNAVYSSINYSLGQTYHKDLERYKRLHDAYTTLFFGAMTCLMCTANLLTIPFVRLYTAGVSDANYVNESLPVLFALVQILSWSRYITGNLSGIAGYAKITSYVSIIEACINIILSVVLVNRFGIVGVLFATVIALPIKVIFLTWLSEKKILKRKPYKYLLILFINFFIFFATVLISKHIQFNVTNYLSFAIHGSVIFCCCLIIVGLINLAVNPSIFEILKKVKRSS